MAADEAELTRLEAEALREVNHLATHLESSKFIK